MNKHTQTELEVPEKKLEDFFDIKGGILNLKGILQTQNFIPSKRGVQIRPDGLTTKGGTLNGTTIASSSLTNPSISGGSFGGSSITNMSSGAGSVSNTTSDVGGSFNQTTLNNNFASLDSKINEILTALRSAGIIT